MIDNQNKSLLPSEEEIHCLLERVIKENPANYPIILLQIETARLIVKFLDSLKGEFNKSIKRLEDSIDSK